MRQRFDNSVPRGEPAGCSLTELAGFIDEHLGREAGLEAAVRGYRTNSDETTRWAAGGEIRRAIHAQLDTFIKIGHNGLVTGGRFVCQVTGGGQKAALRSSVIEQKNPDLWEASKVDVPRMAVKYAYTAKPKMFSPPMNMAADAWREYGRARERERAAKKAADRHRLHIIGIIDDMAELDLWDGALKVTTDGWSVGQLYVHQFNEKICYKLITDQGLNLRELQTLVDIPVKRKYVLITDAAESDEIDGD